MTGRAPGTGARGLRSLLAGLAASLGIGCAGPGPPPALELPTRSFRMPRANSGREAYSAWFADVRGGVLYFGLSPFWDLWWRSGGDSSADLQEPGDHLIGRFDLARERFLPPLRVRSAASGARSSVWDVLAHSNGRVYYTTYFEEIGSVRSDGSDPRWFRGIGAGFNELTEGPGGHLYVTRYSDSPRDPAAGRYGALVELTPGGKLVREIRFEREAGRFTAPKSVAVDPGSGEIWINTDTFVVGGPVLHERIRISADGRVLGRSSSGAELQFAAFDREGRGYFAERTGDRFVLRITSPGGPPRRLPLGSREGIDFVQDIQVEDSGTAAIAFWSGHVTLVRPAAEGFESLDLVLRPPAGCRPPAGRTLLYSAFTHGGKVHATLHCGATVLGVAIPAGAPWRFWPR